VSSQPDVHEQLDAVVARHLRSAWREPIAPYTHAALAALEPILRSGEPLVFDWGCGTGHSTTLLAARHPEAVVIGVDKSAARLARVLDQAQFARRDRCCWLRADAEPLLALLAASGVRASAQYLLFPNPWPKPGHLKRRWHAHPVFPALLRLGGALELRCNWDIYAHEFARALALAGVDADCAPVAEDEPALSPFELKYRASGHALWRVRAKV
jgi:tRNA G46 methylase TrmB